MQLQSCEKDSTCYVNSVFFCIRTLQKMIWSLLGLKIRYIKPPMNNNLDILYFANTYLTKLNKNVEAVCEKLQTSLLFPLE